MKRLFNITGRTLLALLGVVAVACLVLAIVNRHDRPASAASIRLARIFATLPAVPEKDNGYVYLFGFGAGLGQDPQARGAQGIAWLLQTDGQDETGKPGADTAPAGASSAAMKALGAVCKKVDRSCLEALETGAPTIDAWLVEDGWLLERYKALLERPAWREIAPFDMRIMPRFANVLEGQRLLLLQAWTRAGRGDAHTVRTLLERDGRFWRTALASSTSMVPKMIAATALSRNVEWGNLIIGRMPAQAVSAAVPGHWSVPLSGSERSILRVLAGEYIFSERATRLAATADFGVAIAPLMMPTFQRQDYLNRYAQAMASVADAFEVPYADYPAALVHARAVLDKAETGAFDDPLYNCAGNVVIAAGLFDATEYALRLADLEGLRRVALLTAQLRIAKVTAAGMKLRLEQAALGNPYDGKPFWWDASTASIVFVGLEALPRGRHTLPY